MSVIENINIHHKQNNINGLMYDEMSNEIFELNSNNSYDLFENKASLSIISDEKKCDTCNKNYSFITCMNCKKNTCGKSKCCTLYPDMHGYISICTTCESLISKKFKPYNYSHEKKIMKEHKKVANDLKVIEQILTFFP